MTFANAAQNALSYVKETTWGTTPGSPSMLTLRRVSHNLALSKTELVSEERRSDGQVPAVRHGQKSVAGNILAEISYLALKDWMRAALRYDTTAGSFTSTAAADTAFTGGTNKITRTTGSWITDGALVNMKIRVSGSTSGTNDGVFTITAVTALEITVSEALTTQTAGPTVTIRGEYAENGTTETSFSVESGFTDIAQYEVFTGVKVGGFALAAEADAIPTLGFDVLAKSMSISGSSLGTPAAVDDTEPVDTYTAGAGYVLEGGSAIAIVTGLTLNGSWNRAATKVLGSDSAASIEAGRLSLSGSIQAYFQDAAMVNKFINETASTLEFEFQDTSGNGFRIKLPAIKYSGAAKSVAGDEPLTLDMPFTAYRDTTTGLSIIANMIPA